MGIKCVIMCLKTSESVTDFRTQSLVSSPPAVSHSSPKAADCDANDQKIPRFKKILNSLQSDVAGQSG